MSERIVIAAIIGLVLATAAGAAGLVDPTRPPAPRASAIPAEGEEGYRLTSILVAPDRRIAVINGHVVRVGDRVADAQVVGITLTRVQLRGPEGAFELPLHPLRRMKRSTSRE